MSSESINKSHAHPLTTMQRDIYFDAIKNPGKNSARMLSYTILNKEINVSLWEKAVSLIVKKHSVLRTTIFVEDEKIYQRKETEYEYEFVYEDINEKDKNINEYIKNNFFLNHDLDKKLSRHFLLKIDTKKYASVISIHHTVFDGFSSHLFFDELIDIYQLLDNGNTIELEEDKSFESYINYHLNKFDTKQVEKYWKKKLAGVEPIPSNRPAGYEHNEIEKEILINSQDLKLINAFCKSSNISVSMYFKGIYALIIRKVTNTESNFIIREILKGRKIKDYENTIGCIVQTLPLVLNKELWKQSVKIVDYFKYVKEQKKELGENEYISTLLQNKLIDKEEVVYNYNYQPTIKSKSQNRKIEIYAESGNQIHFRAIEDINGLRLLLNYDESYFCEEGFLERVVLVSNQIIADKTDIGELDYITEDEKCKIQTWNITTCNYPKDKTTVDLFEEQVERTPNNIAIVIEDKQLTYSQLNEKANQLAHYILNLKQKNSLVAICLERSSEMIISLLGILKAGCAYVPIDPNYPQSRIRFMLEDSAAPVLLTQSNLNTQFLLDKFSSECFVVCLDEVDFNIQSSKNPIINRQANDLAYVIYTSGSSGTPKGCLITHHNITRLLYSTNHWYQFNDTDVWTLFHSYAFDFSVWEIWGSLLYGGKLIIVPYWISRSTEDFYDLLIKEQVTVLNQTPSAFKQLIREDMSRNESLNLRYVIFGGEALDTKTLQEWFAKHGYQKPQLINMYGITETTVHVTYHPISYNNISSATNVIGKPIPDLQAYIMDAQQQIMPIGTSGELCIAGAGLARGYLNRPELNVKKFIEVEILGKIKRIYKTGDLARCLPDGNIEFIGRIDNQVKLRGFRIELGEIETVLCQHSNIKESVVTVSNNNEHTSLVAHITIKNKKTGDSSLITNLRSWLKNRLPDYMIPAHFTILEHIPLTLNGKIDRKKISELESGKQKTENENYIAPRNEIEQQLVQIWSRLLKKNNIGIHDNFFSLGGDSILSIQLVARARQAGIQLSPRDLFEHQTIADLAHVVGFESKTDAEQELVTGEVLLTPIQHWFFKQNLPEYWHYNQSILLDVPDNLNEEALQQAYNAVVSHHDALRLRYPKVKNVQKQLFAKPSDSTHFFIEDISDFENPASELEKLTLEYQKNLNLTDGPTNHLVLFKLRNSARLFWCIHHLSVDGVSWRILQEDLHKAYLQYSDKQEIQLPAKTSSFKAYAERLKSYADSKALSSELTYWQASPVLPLPMDNPTGENRMEFCRNYIINLSQKETDSLLRDTPHAYNTRINDVLLSALVLALSEWTGETKQLVNLEGHGRTSLFNEIDLSRTVGWFTTIHPVALSLPENQEPGEVLKAIKEQLQKSPNEGIGYGLLCELCKEDLPRGDILFNYLGQFDQGIDTNLFSLTNEITGSNLSFKGKRDHLIDINGAVNQGQLSLNWSYSSDCYNDKTIEKLADSYKKHLQHLISHCGKGKQGITPSDFPLANVTQHSLDVLFKKYSGLEDIYPLSPMQQGLMFHALYEPETGVYFEQMQLKISNLDPGIFKEAWKNQLNRHSIFRSAFLTKHQPILQVVQTEVPLYWTEHNWQGKSEEIQKELLDALLQQERNKGFVLDQAPLMRFDLIKLDDERHIFIWHHHHVLLDGWCLPITFSEVRNTYLAIKQEKSLELPSPRLYREYISWLQKQDKKTMQQYWRKRLSGFSSPTTIPIINNKSKNPNYHNTVYNIDLQSTQQLQSFCKAQRITLNTLIQGAWGLLLSRYSHESDLCFGVTVSGRNIPLSGIEDMIGLFINTLPLRIDANPKYSVKDYLQQLQNQHQDDNRYPHSPLFEIQNSSELPNGISLFESILVFENYPLGDAFEQSPDCYKIENFETIEYTNYPLTLAVMPKKELKFEATYDSNRITDESIKRLFEHLNTLLNSIIQDPEQCIGKLAILTKKETHQLQEWNNTTRNFPKYKTVVKLFEKQVEKTPNSVAVVFEDKQLTYHQLNEKANQLANHLIKLKKETDNEATTQNNLVAICIDRSLEMIISILGTLKAGYAYIPIDPNYPQTRIRFMLEDSQVAILLTQSKLELQLDDMSHNCCEICLDQVNLNTYSNKNLSITCQPNDLAYVIYTSGSMGKPKGVMIEHAALINFVFSSIDTYSITNNDKILQFASISFDAAVEEIYPCLLQGATLVLRTEEMLNTTETFLKRCNEQKLTVLDLPTAYWHTLLTNTEDIKKYWPISIRLVIIGGEAVSRESVNKWLEYFGDYPILMNTYGPTEATVVATSFQLTNSTKDSICNTSIGQAISNTSIHILDAQNNLQPIGIPGEICISGAGLAHGYLNRPELTAEKFIEIEILEKNQRIYKTGDLARWLPDGNIEFLGRIDHQVKIRGFRIELGEIEAVLCQHQSVKESIVMLYDANDNKQLSAYITITDNQVSTNSDPKDKSSLILELRNFLKDKLPDYMIPAYFTILDSLPLTPNGKIDRKALPSPDQIISSTQYEPPQNNAEQKITEVWKQILERERISIHDNFFDLGGHSLLAIKVNNLLHHDYPNLRIVDLFSYPTIHTLANHLEQDTETDKATHTGQSRGAKRRESLAARRRR